MDNAGFSQFIGTNNPSSLNNIFSVATVTSPVDLCRWFSPTQGTPEYYNTNGSPLMDVPTNSFMGTQNDIGNYVINNVGGYAGIRCSNSNTAPLSNREYIQEELQTPLIANRQYYIEFYWSLGDNSMFSVNSIGALLTNGPVIQFNSQNIPQIPQITNPNNGSNLADKNDWNRIAGCFTPTTTMDHITIGNFRDNLNSNISSVDFGTIAQAYYLIDDVTVVPLIVEAGANQVVQCGATVNLGSTNNCNIANSWTYTWNLVQGNPAYGNLNTINPQEPTFTNTNNSSTTQTLVYEVVVTTPGNCTISDRVTLTVNSCCDLNVSINSITSVICGGNTIVLNSSTSSGSGPFTYLWSNGATTSSTIVSAAGVYSVTITDVNGCSNTANYTITQSSFNVQISGITQNCLPYGTGQVNILVTNGVGPYLYTWTQATQSGSGQSVLNQFQISNLFNGNFQISITDQSGCNIVLNYNVPQQIPSAWIFPGDQGVCKGSTISLTGNGFPSGGTLLWSATGGAFLSCTNCLAPDLTVTASTQVSLLYTVNGCSTAFSRNYTAIDVPTAPQIQSPLTNCQSGVAFVNPINPLYSYSWTASNANGPLGVGTGTNCIPDPSWLGPIQLTFTATNATCQRASTVTIYSCCVVDQIPGFPVNMLDWSNRTVMQLMNDQNLNLAGLINLNPVYSEEGLTTTYLGTRYMAAINGTFVVDFPLDLTNANICLGPNANIVINNDQRLLIGEGNWLHSNGQFMWNGIYAADNDGNNTFSSIEVYTGGSIIEEALSAINVTLPSFTRIGQTTLNRNFRNITINSDPAMAYQSTDLIRNRIGAVNITSQLNGVTSNIGVQPFFNVRPSVGVEVNNVRGLDIFGEPILSIGVSELNGPNVWFVGLANNFNDLRMGINIRNSDVKVVNNNFNRIVRTHIVNNEGIAINTRGSFDKITIGGLNDIDFLRQNNFSSNTFGVFANGNSGELRIENNQFNNSENMAVSLFQMKISANILNNTFIDNNCAINISAMSPGSPSRHLEITGNTVNLTRNNVGVGVNTTIFDGVRLANFSNNRNLPTSVRVNNNTFQGEFRNAIWAGNLFPTNPGTINISENTIRITPNSISNTLNGMNVQNSTGLDIASNRVIVPGSSGATPNVTGYFFQNSGSNLIMENSSYALQRGMRFDAGGQGSITGNQLSCNHFDYCNAGILLNNFNLGDQGDTQNSNGNDWDNVITQVQAIGQFVTNYRSKWYVPLTSFGILPYGIPAQFPGVGPNAPAHEVSCGACVVNCNIDPCPACRHAELINAITKYDSLLQFGMNDQLKLFEMDLYFNLPDSTGNNTIDNFKLELSSKDYVEMLQVFSDYLLDSTLNDYSNLIESIQTDNFYSDLIKACLLEYINAEGDFLPDNSAIAEGNYNEYGPAVFIARALTARDEIENISFRKGASLKSESISNNFILWPNPVSNELNLKAEGEYINEISVYNSLGMEVLNKKLSNLSEVKLPINLTDGYYIVKINSKITKKLLILSQ